jgi:hypothetical protein
LAEEAIAFALEKTIAVFDSGKKLSKSSRKWSEHCITSRRRSGWLVAGASDDRFHN